MLSKEMMRCELVSRAKLNACPFRLSVSSPQPVVGLSSVWLSDLVSGLDAAGDDVSAVCSVFRSMSDHSDLRAVRVELSRIPIWYRLCAYSVLSANKISKYEAFGVRSVSGHLFEVGSRRCPKEVLPVNFGKDAYRQGVCVLCFYPVKLATSLGIARCVRWSISDSIVDWICDFSQTEGLRSEPRLVIERQDSDVCYKFSYRGTALSIPDKDLECLSLSDRLYAFTVKNAPVSTQALVSEQIASRRQTFNLIRQLEKEDKIEKVKHGVYIAL